MEGANAMTTAPSLFAEVLAEALQTGPVAGPESLLAALEKEGSPLEALMRSDGADAIRAAIEQDFSFLRLLRMKPEAADNAAKGRWVALIRWMLATVKNWKQSEDARMKELVVALLTSGLCGGETKFWHLLPDEDTPSVEFLSALGKFAAKRQIVYDSRGTASPPIWESEFVEAFQAADTSGDWAEIADMWPRLEYVARPDALLAETVCCLARFDFSGLVRAADALRQCPLVMDMAHALSTSQLLRLASASSSERVRFCCAFTVTRRDEAVELSADEEAALSALLIHVATSPEEWRKWMAAFNTYPLRYPSLQRPLGLALARANREAALIYIDAIKLHPIQVTNPDKSRTLISECLRAFSQQASPEQRHAVWTYAHRRWSNWSFDKKKADSHLSEINRSPLDFAVFSFVCECMSPKEREDALAELKNRLQEVDLTWHSTQADCITEWNRLLSIFQPYAHVWNSAGTSKDALPDKRTYYPFDPSTSLYHRIMYRMHGNLMRPSSGKQLNNS